MRRITCLALLLLFLAVGCGEVPTARVPAQESTVGPDQSGWTVLPVAATPLPYPMPTRAPFTPPPLPSTTPLPVVPVLGAEWAPEAERETYVSTTVVVARVGNQPGEIGYWEAPEAAPVWADRFAVDTYGNIYILDRVNQRVATFDPQGRFVSNMVYGDAIRRAEDLAVDNEGRVYIYEASAYGPTLEEAVPKVKVFDLQGKVLWEMPVPSWFTDRQILAMRVDEQGTLWVEGEGTYSGAPMVEGEPYPVVTVPIGNVEGGFDEKQQQAMVVPGHLLSSGGTIISHALTANGPAFLYDFWGHPLYEIPLTEGVVGLDVQGDLYTEEYLFQQGAIEFTKQLHKYSHVGQTIASFALSLSTAESVQTLVSSKGVVYGLVWNRDVKATYRVVRWQPK